MRHTLSLDGEWRFLLDLDPEYHLGFQYKHPDWDRRHWETVRVPGCWNLYAEKYCLFEGVCWFARDFDLNQAPSDGVAMLRFGAVNYLTHVFLNGEWVGTHEGGYTAFAYDVSRLIRIGRNVIVVRVDNRHQTIKLPPVLGWFNYGGIHRPVWLELSERCRIDALLVHAFPEGDTAQGRLRCSVQGEQPASIQICVEDAAGQVVWRAEYPASATVDVTFTISHPSLWSPTTPTLYQGSVRALAADGRVLDEAHAAFGVRRLTAEGRELRLNGERTLLKGICILCDHPAKGITFDEALFAHDLSDLATLGVNAVRCHFPMDERALDACDRAGLLVWLEVPVYCIAAEAGACGTPFADPETLRLARQMVEEMILQAYNHPSVVLWSVGNECSTAHPEAQGFFSTLVNAARRLDPYRLISYASLYGDGGCMASLADVLGINQYWGWYDRCNDLAELDQHPVPGQALDMSALRAGLQRFFGLLGDKPGMMTEFGADAAPGYRDADARLWSEDYQARLLEATFEVLQDFPPLAGTFWFLYHDYPDPSKLVQRYWNGLNLKGLVTYERVPKAGFESLRRIYHR